MHKLLLAGVVVSILLAGFATSITIASATNYPQNSFKNWRSLIAPILDLQNMVSSLEEQIIDLEERVTELEEELRSSRPNNYNIFLQTEEIFYEAGDDVIVEGAIDDLVQDAPVNLKVLDPQGNIMESQEIDPEIPDGSFEFVFGIPNDAGDGLYTIRGEYDLWTAYTYFMIDEQQQDPVVVEIEDSIYNPGDQVEITGTSEQDAPSADDLIHITILGPTEEEQPIINEDTLLAWGGYIHFPSNLKITFILADMR
jgi:hypothetical protein